MRSIVFRRASRQEASARCGGVAAQSPGCPGRRGRASAIEVHSRIPPELSKEDSMRRLKVIAVCAGLVLPGLAGGFELALQGVAAQAAPAGQAAQAAPPDTAALRGQY